MAGTVKLDSVGTAIRLDTGVDLTAASVVEIVARSPSDAVTTLTATVVETTKAQHTKTASTLNEAGVWTLEARASWTGGDLHIGDPVSLRVYESLRS